MDTIWGSPGSNSIGVRKEEDPDGSRYTCQWLGQDKGHLLMIYQKQGEPSRNRDLLLDHRLGRREGLALDELGAHLLARRRADGLQNLLLDGVPEDLQGDFGDFRLLGCWGRPRAQTAQEEGGRR